MDEVWSTFSLLVVHVKLLLKTLRTRPRLMIEASLIGEDEKFDNQFLGDKFPFESTNSIRSRV